MPSDHGDADAAVGAGAGQHYGHRVLAVGLGQGVEEVVDGGALAAQLLDLRQAQVAVDGGEIAAGRDHIDVVRLHRQVFGDLLHRHRYQGLEQVREHARVLRRQMHDDDIGEAAVIAGAGEELLQGVETAGGGADADDGGLGQGVVLVGHSGFGRWRWLMDAQFSPIMP
jgi:hypothetical protein